VSHLQDNSPIERQRASAHVGPVPTGYERDPFTIEKLDDARDFSRRVYEYHRPGQGALPIGVVFIRLQVDELVKDVLPPDDPA
jgi:hypothetical protein